MAQGQIYKVTIYLNQQFCLNVTQDEHVWVKDSQRFPSWIINYRTQGQPSCYKVILLVILFEC
jgi:hypothetical protein